MFTDDQRQMLLGIARNAIARGLGIVPAPLPLPDADEGLSRHLGVFVTLRIGRDLRGCIGYVEAEEPLVESVDQVAARAAFHDPRFPPLSLSEFRRVLLEISVLSPLCLVKDVAEIEPGVHGLVIELRRARGLLLPQVATEQGWDRIQFLNHTAIKAGLPPSAWQHPEARVYLFSAEVFAEPSLEGARS